MFCGESDEEVGVAFYKADEGLGSDVLCEYWKRGGSDLNQGGVTGNLVPFVSEARTMTWANDGTSYSLRTGSVSLGERKVTS